MDKSDSKMKRIYVTLDTEMDSDKGWVKHYPAEYTSITEGIPQMLRPIWDKYKVHPIYFVSPEVLYDGACVEVLKTEIEKGAVIGAHLHPEYIEPDNIFGEGMEKVKPQFPCLGYADEVEYEKLKKLTDLIEQKLLVKPIWYRAARFGADDATIRSLYRLGYQYDSSVTPGIDWSSKGGPNFQNGLSRTYRISKYDICKEAESDEDFSGICEIPVTIGKKRWGIIGRFLPEHWLFYQWLRPTHMTYFELRHMLKQLDKNGMKENVLMFHSMEIMIHKTPYVRNKWMQKYYLWRLEGIIKYAVKMGYEL